MISNFWKTVFHTNMFIFESYGEDEVEQFSCKFFSLIDCIAIIFKIL